MKTIIHLDLDAFFVSVERVINPKLNGKPVIVGADPKSGRGVVATCSYEARAYGLHSGMPIRKAYRLCPRGIYLRGHYEEYEKYSNAVRKIIERYAPIVEQASIDEFYLDMTGTKIIYGSMFIFASKLQREILDELKLPCSIGIGSNKTIAKISSDFVKPAGVIYIFPGMEKEFLAPMPVEIIPGVGNMMKRRLNARGIYKIADITKLSVDYFSDLFGKYGIDLWRKAHGEGEDKLTVQRERKSISKETTFKEDVKSDEELKQTLFYLTGKVCQSLRDKKLEAATVEVKLRYSDFHTLSRSKTIDATDDDKRVFDTAWELLKQMKTRTMPVRLIGIGVTNLSRVIEQEFLFEDYIVKRKRLFKAVTKIRNKFGYEAITFDL
jgi:DNA polymerase-4